MNNIKILIAFVIVLVCQYNVYSQLKFPDILSQGKNFTISKHGVVDSLTRDFDLTKVQTSNFVLNYDGSSYFFNRIVSEKTEFYLMKEQIDSSDKLYDNRGIFIETDSVILYVGFKLRGSESDFQPYPEIDLIRNGNFNEVQSIMVLDKNLTTKFIVYYETSKALFVDKLYYDDNGRVDVILAGTSADIRKLDLKYDIVEGFKGLIRGEISLYKISPRVPHINHNYLAYLWLFQGSYENELNNRHLYPSLSEMQKK